MESFNNEKIPNLSEKYKSNENGFVQFADVSRGELQKQSQYGSRYVDGMNGEYPNLGDGLRKEFYSKRFYYSVLIYKKPLC